MSASVRMDSPLCCYDRPAGGACCTVRTGGDVRGVCPILVVVDPLQKEHPA
ncbi:hypothetical protein X772_22145 [Mesorhizobium sp. LSJC280B00]|nr:hypothetical protein X772_22145 [Mesorhizobium sp. LSJC280B00]